MWENGNSSKSSQCEENTNHELLIVNGRNVSLDTIYDGIVAIYTKEVEQQLVLQTEL